MRKHLILIGGGHAHMELLLHLEDFVRQGHRVTVVSPTAYQYYSAMGTGLLGGLYQPQETRFHIRKMVEERGGIFREDKVIGLEAASHRLKLLSGLDLSYDLASFNIGSEVETTGLEINCDRVLPVKPISNLFRARQLLLALPEKKPLRLLVAGGGPSGVEIAGNLRRLLPAAGITLISGSRLLRSFPGKMARHACRSLEQRSISIREGLKVLSFRERRAALADGSSLGYDLAFLAIGLKPPSLFSAAGLATGKNNGLLVDSFLRSINHPEIFAGGDCIDFQSQELAKVGVYAVRQGPLIRHNLQAVLAGGEPQQQFKPQKKFLLILNLGDSTGLLGRGRWIWHGHLAYLLKDRIDRRFMKKYQVSAETAEPALADPLLDEKREAAGGNGDQF
jgi:NADH dehydrogenase FAD-containing subunit